MGAYSLIEPPKLEYAFGLAVHAVKPNWAFKVRDSDLLTVAEALQIVKIMCEYEHNWNVSLDKHIQQLSLPSFVPSFILHPERSLEPVDNQVLREVN